MDTMDEEERYEKRARAGLIPYMRAANGELQYLMMISSNSKFGGPRPMLSKGKIEPDEDELECALREAEEELGLLRSNLRTAPFLVASERVALRSGAYHLTVFAAPIIDRHDFGKWCDETEYVEWHTLESFKEHGRRDHVRYVEELEARLRRSSHEAPDPSA